MSSDTDTEKGRLDATGNAVAHESPSSSPQPVSIHALDWDGENDPENPHNWGFLKRAYHTVIPALFAFTTTFAASVYVPSYPEIMARFSVSSTVAIFGGLSLYLLGLGFGPMLAAPLSETHGRRSVYLGTFPFFMLFILGAGFAHNFATLCVCRFFAGFFGSPTLAVGGGSGADMFLPNELALACAFYFLAPFAGPAIGPVVGGFAAEYKGWRWTQWTILFIALFSYLAALGTSETYKKTILTARAKKAGITLTKPDGRAALKLLFTITLTRPARFLVAEPIVVVLALYSSFAFAVIFSFFAAFPTIFATTYGFSIAQTGLTFLALSIGCLLAFATIIWTDAALYQPHHRRHAADPTLGPVLPEHRLYTALMGSLGLPLGLFWFGWTARADVFWLCPVAAAIPFAWGNLCLFTAVILYLVDVYGPLNGASAMAATGLLRYLLGAAFPLFTLQMYARLGTAWASSLLGFVTVALMPVPWVLMRWGPWVRARSRFTVVKS